MKNFVGAAIAAAGLAGLAMPASAADTAAVAVNATVAPVCTFTTKPAASVTIAPTAGQTNIGDLGYTCNYTGNVTLTLDLPNGSQLFNPSNGGSTVAYGLAWTLPPNPSTPVYQTWTSPQSIAFAWPTAGAPNVENKGSLWVDLPTNLPVAGTYSSVISYTIVP